MERERRDGGRGFIPSHLILVCEAAELVVLHQLKELSSSQEYLRKTLSFTSYSPSLPPSLPPSLSLSLYLSLRSWLVLQFVDTVLW